MVGNGGIAMEFVYAVLVVAPPLMSQRTIIGSVLRRGVAAAGQSHRKHLPRRDRRRVLPTPARVKVHHLALNEAELT